jgi:hypothetical protein
MRFADRECCSVRGRRGHRVPLPWRALVVSDGARGITAHRPRLIVRQTGSSSRLHVTPLQSTSRSRLPGLLTPGASRGVPSLFATSTGRSFHGAPIPHGSVLDVLHVLDGLLHPRPCGFVSPRCHVQGSPFRGFPSRAAVLPRRQPCPRAVVDRPLLKVAPQRHELPTRPQGLVPRENPSSRSSGFSRRPDPIPSWVSPPPGVSPRTHRTG